MRYGFIILAALFLIIFMNVSRDFKGWGKPQLYPPSIEIQHFTFGQRDTMADSFWLRALQDFDKCDQSREGSSLNPKGIRMGLDRTPSCKKGWLFHTLNLIMELAPRFYMVARVAPLTLSVVIDDIEGATILFDKAMQNFPNDWIIRYRAAYHYMMELEDKTRAAQLFMDAYNKGAPEWTPLLAAKLHERNGDKDVARFILTEFLKNDLQDEDNKAAAEEKLESLEK